MAVNVELITGHGEGDHISSFDMRAFNRSIFGNGRYIFNDANNLEVSAKANETTIAIKAGSCMWSGMHIRIEEDGYLSYLTPPNTDSVYVWLHYTRSATTAIESIGLEVTSAYKVDSSLVYDELPDDVTEAYTLLGEFTHNKETTTASDFKYSFTKVQGLDDFFKEATQKLNVQASNNAEQLNILKSDVENAIDQFEDKIPNDTLKILQTRELLMSDTLTTNGSHASKMDLDFSKYVFVEIEFVRNYLSHDYYRVFTIPIRPGTAFYEFEWSESTDNSLFVNKATAKLYEHKEITLAVNRNKFYQGDIKGSLGTSINGNSFEVGTDNTTLTFNVYGIGRIE